MAKLAIIKLPDPILRKVDHGDTRADRIEGKRDLAPDAAGSAGEQHRLPFEAGVEIEGHGVLPIAPAAA